MWEKKHVTVGGNSTPLPTRDIKSCNSQIRQNGVRIRNKKHAEREIAKNNMNRQKSRGEYDKKKTFIRRNKHDNNCFVFSE